MPTTGLWTVVSPTEMLACTCTIGATAAIPGARWIASTCWIVSGVPLPATPRSPPPKPRPLVTVSVLAPSPLNWLFTSAAEPLPTATRVTTEPTPITMPSTVSAERAALARSRSSARRTEAIRIMAHPRPDRRRCRRCRRRSCLCPTRGPPPSRRCRCHGTAATEEDPAGASTAEQATPLALVRLRGGGPVGADHAGDHGLAGLEPGEDLNAVGGRQAHDHGDDSGEAVLEDLDGGLAPGAPDRGGRNDHHVAQVDHDHVADVQAGELVDAGVGLVEQAQDVQQGALAGSGGPLDGDPLASVDLEMDVVQDGNGHMPSPVGPGERPGAHDR